MRLLLASLLLCLGLSSVHAAQTADLYRALMTADDAAMASYVEDHYRDAGASLDDRLTWDFRPFDIIVNLYDTDTISIILGAMPGDDEVEAYWRNWSRALTQSRWQPDAFFANAAEAALLARYNQFVLAAHEYGHALTYRYDPDHVPRHDNAVNCREFYADRLATSLVHEVSARSAALAAIEARYVELMASFNAEIAPADHYAIGSLDLLETDCAQIHVDQPDETTMAPYASAFFERWRLLLAANPPPLADLFKKHLFARHKFLPAADLAGAVLTVGATYAITSFEEGTESSIIRIPMLTSTGYFVAEVQADKATGRQAVAYGPAGAPAEMIADLLPSNDLTILAATAFGPDRFVVMTTEPIGNEDRLLILDARRGHATWTITPSRPVEGDIPNGSLLLDPLGGLHLFSVDTRAEMILEHGYRYIHTHLDPESLAILSSTPLDFPTIPIAVGKAGEIYTFQDGAILVLHDTGQPLTFAGTGLIGFKDNADPRLAEFTDIRAAFPTTDGGLVVIDVDPRTGAHMLRGIEAKAE